MSLHVSASPVSAWPAPADAGERSQAVLTEEHAFVWAGAGTGKTHTLTHRALHLLLQAPFLDCFRASHQESAGVELTALYRASERSARMGAARRVVRSLVLTTFTRKASAEMQTRLHDDLRRVAELGETDLQDPPPKERLLAEVVDGVLSEMRSRGYRRPMEKLRRGAEALAELAADMQISTLHSFSAGLLRRHPLEAGIPPGAHFAREDETDLSVLPRQLIDRWWNRQALRDPRLGDDLARVLAVAAPRQIDVWLQETLFNPWLARLEAGEHADGRQALGCLKEVVERLHHYWPGKKTANLEELTRLVQAVCSSAAQQDDGSPDGPDPGALGRLLRFLSDKKSSLFLDSEERWKTLDKALEASSPQALEFFAGYADLQRPLVGLLLDTRWASAWKSLRRLLANFAQWSQGAALRELGLVTFDDMIEKAVKLLEDHPDIRRREQQRLAVLLVDEFQDTDPLQLRLLELLLKREEAQRVPLGFFVGDRKQSIYRFRGADLPALQSFLESYAEITGSEPRQFQLTTSFRSLEPVLDFINEFFHKEIPAVGLQERLDAFHRPRSQQPSPPAHRRRRPARDQMALPFEAGERPQWIHLRDERPQGRGFSASEARRITAAQAVRSVSGLRQRGYAYKEISLLVRKESELDPILAALRQAGVPYVSTGARTFYRQPEVLDLLNLLIAMHHPDDTLACAALLRGPWVGLDDASIQSLLPQIKEGLLLQGQEPLPEDLPALPLGRLSALRRLARVRLEMSTQDWLQQVRNRLPLESYVSRHDHEGRSLVRLERLLASYRLEVEEGSEPVLLWLLEQRRRADRGDRFDADLGEDVSISDESLDAVRVLTIHKAKGLENRAVIVCGWHSVLEELKGEFPSREPAVLADHSGPSARPQSGHFALPLGPLTIQSQGYARALEEEKQRNRDEAMRLAYVAATRAREQLVLISAQHSFRSKPAPEIRQLMQQACLAAEQAGGRSELGRGTLAFHLLAACDPRRRAAPPEAWPLGEDYEELWEGRRQRQELWAGQPLWRSPTDEFRRADDEMREEVSDWRERPLEAPDVRRLAGNLVHQWLEEWDGRRPPERSGLELLLQRQPQWGQWEPASVEDGADPGGHAVDRAESLLKAFVSGRTQGDSEGPLVERYRAGRILAKELPVHLEYRNEPWYGVIDLVLEEGQTVIAVDYKTGRRHASPEYRRQRQLYLEALRRLFPNRRVAFEFWWLDPSQESDDQRFAGSALPPPSGCG
ncbi:MAG TPA: UvrD-helicase domain-containing protein [Acidobacteriota bacterium]|nr:UvrD-helicase domain-containing protein [Acidobacteriota bacterium]